MRSIVLLIIIFGSLPIILAKPYIGSLMWAWISFMNPHRLTWGFTYDFAFAQIVGGISILAWLISKEPKSIPRNTVVTIMFLFGVWVSLTTIFALAPDDAFGIWKEVIKILVMTYVTLCLVQSKERLHGLIWVIVVSIGLFGVKGGIFVIWTGGEYLVWGPSDSALEANNAIGVALAMTLPLMRYLQVETKSKLVYWGLMAAMPLCALSILATYSRGAVLAVGAMCVFLWLRSQKKVLIGVAVTAVLVAGLSFMPQKWHERLDSINTYEEDWSAMDRIKIWKFGYNVAVERPLVGGGFGVFPQSQLYERFGLGICTGVIYFLSPTENCVLKPRTSHSIYFQVLGEHGFVGLGLFLLMGLAAMNAGRRIIRMTAGKEDLAWARNLAGMVQTSLVAYAVGGLFVNKAYFDLYYHMLVIMVTTFYLVSRQVRDVQSRQPEPAIGRAQAAEGSY